MTQLLPVVLPGLLSSIRVGIVEQGNREFVLNVFRSMAQSNPHLAGYLHGILGDKDEDAERGSTEDFLAAMAVEHGPRFDIFASACVMYRVLESQAEADAMNREFT